MNKTDSTQIYYKAVRKDGTSHYDSKTLWTPGVEIVVPNAPKDGESCGVGIHGCPTLLGVVGYQTGQSKYLTFAPTGYTGILGHDTEKYRFERVMPGEYLTPEEVDRLAGFKLWEANNPVNPLLVPMERRLSLDEAIVIVAQWASVRASVWDSVRASVGDSVRASVRASVWDSVGDSVRASVGTSVWDSVGDSWDSVRDSWDSVRDSVWDSVRDSVSAYTGGLFPSITSWKYAESLGADPWRPLLTLWYGGYVPSYDGSVWRLHAGEKAEIVWEGKVGG